MSFDLIFLGGTGDLVWRKLMPALFQAFRHRMPPVAGRVLAVARDDHDGHSDRAWLKERLNDVEVAKRPNKDEFADFARQVHCLRADLAQGADCLRLRDGLATPRNDRPLPGQVGGAEPDGAAFRQRPVRAAVAAREHCQHPDHAGRTDRRGTRGEFQRSDEQEQAWRWVEPILRAWQDDEDASRGPRPCPAGTWGPAAASALVARDGFAWPEEH
jgi:glucose-6-phosphate 1-dehydrogenase